MKIKVLYVINDPGFGGGSRHLLELIEGLDKKKFTPFLISTPSPILDKCQDRIKCFKVEMKSRLDLQAVKNIKNIIEDIKPDIIHVHSTRAGILGTIAARGLNIPVIYTEHLFTNEYVPQNKLIHIYQLYAFKYLSKNIEKVIAVSKAVKDYLVDKNIFPANKVEVVYHGIKPSLDFARDRSATSYKLQDKTTIGSVGALSNIKGYKYLIEAFNNLQNDLELKAYDLRLELIGIGPDQKELENIARKYKLRNKVFFLGQKNNIFKSVAKWDIYVQPSLSESFGLALAEAMNLGIPVVASNVGGMKEIVDNKSGILVEPKNISDLTNAIKKLILDSKMRNIMGKNAKNRIEAYFSYNNMIQKTEEIYEKLYKKSA
jgi:glycosyltransferase involved in cell wall biosynthesis